MIDKLTGNYIPDDPPSIRFRKKEEGMRKLLIEVDCGEKYCDRCQCQSTSRDWCMVFGESTEDTLKWDVSRRSYIRCPECLAAEQAVKERK